MGDVLFPRRDEFDDFFTKRSYNSETGDHDDVPVRPGSRRYMEAMKKADAGRRHFLRILLFMQRLIDRTKVFKPLPAPQINLCDIREHEEFLNLLKDAEMVLSDGRPRFKKWLADINSRMEVGMRVIGEFHSYHSSLHSDLGKRSHPEGHRPESHALHTIERKDGGYFYILFRYKLWNGWSSKRASFHVQKRDTFVINFDLITVGDIDYYLSNRLDRGGYTELFPLLKCARRLKKREQEEEAPFRKLLAGEIAKAHGVPVSEAMKSVDKFIKWWKYKNKTHRGLTSDDAKVVRMIVHEYGLTAKREQDLKDQQALVAPVVKALRKAVPKAIYIGHRKGHEYATITPMNVDDLFVCERPAALRQYEECVAALQEQRRTRREDVPGVGAPRQARRTLAEVVGHGALGAYQDRCPSGGCPYGPRGRAGYGVGLQGGGG